MGGVSVNGSRRVRELPDRRARYQVAWALRSLLSVVCSVTVSRKQTEREA